MLKPLLQIDNANLRVGSRSLIKGLSWFVEPGQVWAVVGLNGCGKSTLLRWLADLPLARGFQLTGRRFWVEVPPETFDRSRRAQFLAWMPQSDEQGFDCTVTERLLAGLYPKGQWLGWESQTDIQQADNILTRYDLAGMGGRFLSTLSGGERRRVAMAAAQLQAAKVTLLDEPLSQLDWKHQVQIGKLFKSWPSLAERALVWVTHEPNMALRFSTHLLAIGPEGQTWQGPICEMANSDLFAQVYGCPVESAAQPFVLFPKTD